MFFASGLLWQTRELDMNKTDVIRAVADRSDVSVAIATKVEAALRDVVGEALGRGEDVMLGLGKLRVKQRNARTARNPRTGEPIQVAARKVVHFKPAPALQSAV
jgi:DNA-binding protein HU-beta